MTEETSASICHSCNLTIDKNFCSNCGQKKYKRIDRKYIWDEIQYSTIHTNKGFLYSIKNIFKNPGKTAREFIDGNRVNHYKPISLAFILSGLSTFISFKIVGMDAVLKSFYQSQKMSSQLMNDMLSFMASYNSFIMLLFIPLMAILTSLIYRKWGQNYFEHMVMNAFGLNFYTIFSIVILYPILFFLKDNPAVFQTITTISMLILPISMVWFYKAFYPDKSLKTILLRVLLILLLLAIIYFIIIIMVTIVVVVLKGPEAMNYIKPN
jgi:hypothetical protein